MGVNLAPISYYSSEQPFLNIVKSGIGGKPASTNKCPQVAWGPTTSAFPNGSTGEEGYIQLDSNGYPTSLVASPTPPGGQQFDRLSLMLNYNITAVPGVTYPYAAANTVYRLKGSGNCVLQISGDASAMLTLTGGASASTTFTVATPGTGLILTVLAASGGAAATYLTDVSVVENAYAASYDAGAIFHPKFLASLANYSRLRFMDWNKSNTQAMEATFTGALTAGATTGTLNAAWIGLSGTYPVLIGNFYSTNTSEYINATFTFGSTAVAFADPGLVNSYAVSGSHYPVCYANLYSSWASRPTQSYVSYGPLGVPYDVQVALCNAANADMWVNIPIWANTYSGLSAYWTSLATLIYGSLSNYQKAYVEFSNEVWNGSFSSCRYAYLAGLPQFYAAQGGYNASQEWYGTQVAQIADAFYTTYGSTAFASRVRVSMGGQNDGSGTGNGVSFLKIAMNTPDWTSAAYTHHISSIHLAGYLGAFTTTSSADCNAILATSVPLDTCFGLAYTNVVGGVTYTSMPAEGFVLQQSQQLPAFISGYNTQPWANLPVLSYEFGPALIDTGTPGSGVSGWNSLMESMQRDPRMEYVMYDPTHQLSATHNGYIPSVVASGLFTDGNQYYDIGTQGNNGDWGALESVQQTISPLSSAPSKYRGIMNYALGN